MATSSKTTPKRPDPQTLLLVGPPGGGKTSLILRFRKLAIVDIDLRLDGAEAHLRQKDPDLTYDYFTPAYDDKGKPRPKEQVWDAILRDTISCAVNPAYDWLALDGLSSLNYHLIDWVLGRTKKPSMEQSDWIPFRQELLKLLNTVKLSGKNYILTAHEEVTADRDGTIKKRNLLVDSRLRDAIGGWFSNVWRCYPTPGAGGRTIYNIDTRPTGVDDLKSSSPDIGTTIVIDSSPKPINPFNFDRDVLRHLTPTVAGNQPGSPQPVGAK